MKLESQLWRDPELVREARTVLNHLKEEFLKAVGNETRVFLNPDQPDGPSLQLSLGSDFFLRVVFESTFHCDSGTYGVEPKCVLYYRIRNEDDPEGVASRDFEVSDWYLGESLDYYTSDVLMKGIRYELDRLAAGVLQARESIRT